MKCRLQVCQTTASIWKIPFHVFLLAAGNLMLRSNNRHVPSGSRREVTLSLMQPAVVADVIRLLKHKIALPDSEGTVLRTKRRKNEEWLDRKNDESLLPEQETNVELLWGDLSSVGNAVRLDVLHCGWCKWYVEFEKQINFEHFSLFQHPFLFSVFFWLYNNVIHLYRSRRWSRLHQWKVFSPTAPWRLEPSKHLWFVGVYPGVSWKQNQLRSVSR